MKIITLFASAQAQPETGMLLCAARYVKILKPNI